MERLCSAPDPDVALAMFHKDTRWTRAWVRGNFEAWYVAPRRSRPLQLKYTEEVIVVAYRPAASGTAFVSGTGSYDVYRWDGTCVSLMEGELTFLRPPTVEVATIPWTRLDEDVQGTLAKNERIALRNTKRREACNDVGARAQKQCARAEVELSRMIADYVRDGGALPGR